MNTNTQRAPRIKSEADLIACQLMEIRKRLHQHRIWFDFEFVARPESRHKLEDLNQALRKLGSKSVEIATLTPVLTVVKDS